MSEGARIRRLRWLCRRGMKELDILLERFVDDQRAALSDGDWPEFERLLAAEDDRLWDWILDPSEPGAAEYGALLDRIRRASD